MNFPSKLVEDAVFEVAKLPGIGKKTALRLVLHLLKKEANDTLLLTQALHKVRTEIKTCKACGSLSDFEICSICSNPKRENGILCIVEDTKDILAIENTHQFYGKYHVLGGIISPMERIGPDQLNIEKLLEKIADNKEISEIILALSPTMEGDTTAFYLTKKIKPFGIKISTIARGIPFGGELEYMDEITLGRSISTRTTVDTNTD
jgi:recombination protein RecR